MVLLPFFPECTERFRYSTTRRLVRLVLSSKHARRVEGAAEFGASDLFSCSLLCYEKEIS